MSTPGDRFAYWLSQITSPFVVGLGVLGYISLSTASTVTEGLQWLTVIGVGLLVPFGWIWWGVKTGKLTDIHVSRRSERLVPLVVGLMALGGMLAGLLRLSALLLILCPFRSPSLWFCHLSRAERPVLHTFRSPDQR